MKIHATTQYATDVVYGKTGTQCGKYEILSCARHLHDLERQNTDDFPYVFDETRADRIFRWFSICRHLTGAFAGQPILLEDWQKFDYGCAFGWVHKDTGKRRFRKSYSRIARGHAKSICMSAIGNYGMCADAMYPPGHPEQAIYESAPEVVCVAVDREQARIVWNDAKSLAENSPDIAKRLDIRKLSVKHKTRGGAMIAMSKDTKNKDGGRPSIIIVDEYHANPTSAVKDTVESGMGKRAQHTRR